MRKTFLALAAALAIPAAAQADVPTHCAPNGSGPGSVFACASFTVGFDPVTGVITVKIQNTDVWAVENGLNPEGHWYGITAFGIQSPEITGASLGGVTTEGGATTYGSPEGLWDFDTNIDGIFVQAGADATGINGAIYGCNGTAGANGFVTCVDDMNAGYVVFTFNTTMTSWDASSAQIAFRAQGGEWSYRCADAPQGNAPPCTPPTSTVPEPISMVLLGTGLLGVGGVNLRRRRKNVIDV